MQKPRSYDQHKRFFAMIAAVYHQWPEMHAFQAENEEHLRAWLLVKAKHCTIKTFYLSGDTDELARLVPIITATMLHKHSWCRSDGNSLHVCVPNSINYETVKHKEFCAINDAVDEIIRAETGIDPEALLREKAA